MKNILIVVLSFIVVFFFVIGNWELPAGRYYRCGDLDFHPDVPPQVRVECRKIIREQLDEEQKRNSNSTGYTT
jgi:hypothetical protein